MSADADDYPLGEFAPYSVPTRSGVQAVTAAADRIHAHKQAVDEIRAYTRRLAETGTLQQIAIAADILQILAHHKLT